MPLSNSQHRRNHLSLVTLMAIAAGALWPNAQATTIYKCPQDGGTVGVPRDAVRIIGRPISRETGRSFHATEGDIRRHR